MSSHLYSKLMGGRAASFIRLLLESKVEEGGAFRFCFKICSSCVRSGIFNVIMGLARSVLAITRGGKGGDFLLNAFCRRRALPLQTLILHLTHWVILSVANIPG